MVTVSLAALCACCAEAQTPGSVPIEAFESSLAGWSTNDGLAPKVGRPTLAGIYLVTPGAEGKQAGLIEYGAAEGTWASVSKTVDGEAWVAAGCTGLSLRLRGDGGQTGVRLVLRSYVKVGDQLTDTSYKKEIALASREWFGLKTPFWSFRDQDDRPIDEIHLQGVKLLQFVKAGTWPALRFEVDDIRAEALPEPAPSAATQALLLDFDSLGNEVRLQPGVCLGSDWSRLLTDEVFSVKVKGALAVLGRPTIRVRLSDFYLPGGLGLRTSDLDRILAWIRSAGGAPLVCLDQPLVTTGVKPEEGWRRFGAFCAEVAKRRRSEPGPHDYEIGSEWSSSGQFSTIEAATEAYNALAAQVLLADPGARVGGLGFASAWEEELRYFAEHARTLDFLTYHFYGAHAPVASDEDLFDAACRAEARDLPNQLTAAQVRDLLDQRPGRRVELWITECALNSARAASGEARDPRIRGHYGAAWAAAVSLATAASVDRVLWFKVYGSGWGLLSEEGTPTPAFQALSLLQRALPTGAAVGTPTRCGKPVFLAATATKDGRFVLLAHAARSSVAELALSGTPAIAPTRLRHLYPSAPSVVSHPLTPSPEQRLTLVGPGVAVLEAAPR